MPITNPDFEIQGSFPGEAEGWLLSTYVAKERIAGFGPEPYQGVEDFERWVEFKTRFDASDLVIGFFDEDTLGFEDFENGWDNSTFIWELPSNRVEAARFGPNSYDDMATGWTGGEYRRQFDQVDSAQAPLNEGTEDFESNWPDDQPYQREFDSGPSEGALFNGGSSPHEPFNRDDWPTDEEELEQSLDKSNQ